MVITSVVCLHFLVHVSIELFFSMQARLQVKQRIDGDKRHHYKGIHHLSFSTTVFYLFSLLLLLQGIRSLFLLLQTLLKILIHHFLHSGTFDAITKLVQYEGLTGMYKGMGTKIVQSVFASAMLFMIKEELVKGARLLVTGNTSLVKKLPSKPS